jgi:hypothetical protein
MVSEKGRNQGTISYASDNSKVIIVLAPPKN